MTKSFAITLCSVLLGAVIAGGAAGPAAAATPVSGVGAYAGTTVTTQLLCERFHICW